MRGDSSAPRNLQEGHYEVKSQRFEPTRPRALPRLVWSESMLRFGVEWCRYFVLSVVDRRLRPVLADSESESECSLRAPRHGISNRCGVELVAQWEPLIT